MTVRQIIPLRYDFVHPTVLTVLLLLNCDRVWMTNECSAKIRKYYLSSIFHNPTLHENVSGCPIWITDNITITFISLPLWHFDCIPFVRPTLPKHFAFLKYHIILVSLWSAYHKCTDQPFLHCVGYLWVVLHCWSCWFDIKLAFLYDKSYEFEYFHYIENYTGNTDICESFIATAFGI